MDILAEALSNFNTWLTGRMSPQMPMSSRPEVVRWHAICIAKHRAKLNPAPRRVWDADLQDWRQPIADSHVVQFTRIDRFTKAGI